MKCFKCKSVGYSHQFSAVNGNAWCGRCAEDGTRTITPGMGGGMSGSVGGLTESVGGVGTLQGLPKLVSLAEWKEIQRLCRKLSSLTDDFSEEPAKGRRTLTDEWEAPKTDPKVTRKPLVDEMWMPLDKYLQSDTSQSPNKSQNLFG